VPIYLASDYFIAVRQDKKRIDISKEGVEFYVVGK
jgi:hypothetical protein